MNDYNKDFSSYFIVRRRLFGFLFAWFGAPSWEVHELWFDHNANTLESTLDSRHELETTAAATADYLTTQARSDLYRFPNTRKYCYLELGKLLGRCLGYFVR